VSRMALQCTALMAQISFDGEKIPAVLEALTKVSSNLSWHIRSATLPFVQIFVFNHIFLLTDDQLNQFFELIISHLSDSQVEVRELAKIAMSSLVRSSSSGVGDQRIAKLVERFTKQATTTRGRTPSNQNNNNETQHQQHGAVLGLAALLATAPYDVPNWMPQLLVTLAELTHHQHIVAKGGASSPIKDTVKSAFAEFWRTHQDMWSISKSKFTEGQLEIINEHVFSQSYYI